MINDVIVGDDNGRYFLFSVIFEETLLQNNATCRKTFSDYEPYQDVTFVRQKSFFKRD